MKEINIAEILKNKPKGLNLYSPVYGKVKFEAVHKDKIYFYHDINEHSVKSNGKSFDDGEVVIFPSKEMRDWRKFFKKGDVLVNKDRDVHVIFERFADDTYCSFVGKYYLWKENNDTEHFYKNERLLTSDFQKAGEDSAQTYINTLEEHLDGKLNLETLEIEKQLEFKDGDIVVYGKSVAICRKIYKHTLSFYVSLNEMFGLLFADEVESSEEYRYATEEEKKQLFDALAKECKAWDSEKKQIVDLKPKVELKPFDRVLCRDGVGIEWHIDLFESVLTDNSEYNYKCMDNIWKYCIPYEGNEHLLGTTKDVEG